MSAIDDYKQLLEAYPNANKFLSALKSNVSKVVPTREELEDPEKRYEFALNAATNAPMGLAVKAQPATELLRGEYVGGHLAPSGDFGAPLHDLTINKNEIYPDDVYSREANNYYGSGEPEDAQIFSMARYLRNKPDEKVTIYRAVPHEPTASQQLQKIESDMAAYLRRNKVPADYQGTPSKYYDWASAEKERLLGLPEETPQKLGINAGDWVALDRKYAKEHGESALGGKYKIVSKKVPARQVFTNGDSIREWGWDPRYAEGGAVSTDDTALSDYAQLLDAYPNAKKFLASLGANVEKIVPSVNDLRDSDKMMDVAMNFGPSNLASGLAVKALKLYHGGTEPVPKVKREGIFDAIFATPYKDVASSHGDALSRYYVNEKKIGRDFGEKGDETLNLIRQYYPDASDDDVNNILYPIIAEDSPALSRHYNEDDILRLTGQPDMAEASWALQADRGRIGKALGYDAITTQDEHGTSYIIPFGSKAKYRKYAEGGAVSTDDTALSDYSQLLEAYPNAKKFLASLGANVEKIVPSVSDLRDSNKMMDVAMSFGPSNLASGLAGVIKQKGGNWLSGDSPERAVSQLKTIGPVLPQYEIAKESVNNWLDQKLAKYTRNEMGTPEDPIRALAEKGILHVNPENLRSAESGAKFHRYFAGLPEENTALSDLAKKWEDVADYNIDSIKVKNVRHKDLSENPWIEKLNPDENVYGVGTIYGMGFEHLRDELRNATRHDSDLPEALRIDPSKLSKVSVPQAVERVAKINEWRAAQKAAADAALARNPATHLHKDYPEQGLSWVELKQPKDASDTNALADALKYEGDVMGHCVGGYCPDVVSGRSRIFSLRDAKGEPHVTIETKPSVKPTELFDEYFIENNLTPEEAQLYKASADLPGVSGIYSQLEAANLYDTLLDRYNKMSRIVQIKGKGNQAPAEKYLPAVQDFVRSGKWSDVGDIKNTGFNSLDELMKGYAQGGHVEINHDTINDIMQQFESEYGLRPDGSEKGRGYLNELKRPDGAVMTEYSIGLPVEGVEMDVPTLVPSLNIEEIKTLLNLPERGRIPESIVKKASEHAEKRVKSGKSVWATPEESEYGER